MEIYKIQFDQAYKGEELRTVLANLRRLKWVSRGIEWENEFEVGFEEEFVVSRIFGIEINDVKAVWSRNNERFEVKFVNFLVSYLKVDRIKVENLYKYIVDDSIAPENNFLFSYVQSFVRTSTSSLDIIKSLFFSTAFSAAYYWVDSKNLIEDTKKVLKLKIVDKNKDLNGPHSENYIDFELKTGWKREDNLIFIGKNSKNLIDLELARDDTNIEEIFAIISLKSNGIHLLDISESQSVSIKRDFYVSLYQGINLLIGDKKSLKVTEMKCFVSQVLEFNLKNFNVSKSYKIILYSEAFVNPDGTENICIDQTSPHQTNIFTYNVPIIISNKNFHIPLTGQEEISLLIFFDHESQSWILYNTDKNSCFWQYIPNSKSLSNENENLPVNIGFGPSEILISDTKLELIVDDNN